ncbi:hypothetical protein D3C80_1686920 [compost metagenome]
MGFVDRHLLRVTVNGRAGRKHQVPDACAHHRLEQRQGGGDVVLVVLGGRGNRLADLDERRKVKHGIELILVEQGVQRGLIGNVQCRPLDAGAR